MKHSKDKAMEQVQNLGQNASDQDKQNIESRLSFMNKGPVKKIWGKVQYLYEAYKNAHLPVSLQLTVIGALLYLILPADVIPDYVPGLGLLDDVSVLLLVFKEVSKYAVPKAIEAAQDYVIEKYCKSVEQQCKKVYHYLVYAFFIVLAVAVAGVVFCIIPACCILPLKIFYVLLILGELTAVFVLYKKLMNRYGNIIKPFVKSLSQTKSFHETIKDFLYQKFPQAMELYKNKEKIQSVLPGNPELPDLDLLIDDFLTHNKKLLWLALEDFLLIFCQIFVSILFFCCY